MKYQKLAEAEEQAHVRHLEWKREVENIEFERKNRDFAWAKLVLTKRKQEDEINSQKLMDAKQKFLQSQNHLRNLMLEKQERRDKLHQNAQLQRNFNFVTWKLGEEARRGAVEEALDQLLARDTQYRKELKGHVENRVDAAKERRAFHRQQYIQVCHAQLNFMFFADLL